MRIAIVHDYLLQMGGAERVVRTLFETFPDSVIFTSAYAEASMPAEFRAMPIRVSFMQKLPGIDRHYRPYFPLYPLAFNSLNVDDFDLIIASSSGWAHGVRTRPDQRLICYCYTPARWLWSPESYFARERHSFALRHGTRPALGRLRKRDARIAQAADRYIAISNHIARRIKECYGRDSEVIYPPVDTARFSALSHELTDDHYLVVSRLVPYKRIDLVVNAFNQLGLRLKIAGTGPDMAHLQTIAKSNIEFLGNVPDNELPQLMARSQALIFPGSEDFGITPVEAMAAGRPVVAYAGGGALETVVEGVTGVLMEEQSPEALMAQIRRLDSMEFDTDAIRQHAMAFDKRIFMSKFKELVGREHRMSRGSDSPKVHPKADW
jgi:glycosyltransferase involved in cell wall biosynthesis